MTVAHWSTDTTAWPIRLVGELVQNLDAKRVPL